MEIDLSCLTAAAQLEIEDDKQKDFTEYLVKMMKTITDLPDIPMTEEDCASQARMPLRADVVAPSCSQEDILRGAPASSGVYFLAPHVMET